MVRSSTVRKWHILKLLILIWVCFLAQKVLSWLPGLINQLCWSSRALNISGGGVAAVVVVGNSPVAQQFTVSILERGDLVANSIGAAARAPIPAKLTSRHEQSSAMFTGAAICDNK